METESLHYEIKIIIDRVELMEMKVLKKNVKWKKRNGAEKARRKDKNQV